MAVYTNVSDTDLDAFLAQYDLGRLVSCKGIAEGVENSNFLLLTDAGHYILTLYEKRTRREDLPFFLGLMEHLSTHGISCPLPVMGHDGQALRDLCDRPAAITTFLPGQWPRKIAVPHCSALGKALAQMHLAAQGFAMQRPNNLSLDGWRTLLDACTPRMHEVSLGFVKALPAELEALNAAWPQSLPMGAIHADLFPDNVFFQGQELTGLIDFYFACTDALAYDLAICLNAWCFEPDGAFNVTKARALLRGYNRVRPLNPQELDALPLLCRGSALRFLLTRLYDWLNPVPGALVKPKNPLEYWTRLRFHQHARGLGAYGLDVGELVA